MFDADYIKRLWCVFEVAVYLRLREKPRVIFINTSQKMVEIFSVTARLLLFLFVLIYSRVSMSLSVNDKTHMDDEWFMLFQLGAHIAIASVQFFLGQRWFKDMISLRETIADYDIRDAQLANPPDRLMLLQLINHYWGDAEENDANQEGGASASDANATVQRKTITGGLKSFNNNIRNQVRRILPVSGPRSWVIFSYFAAVLYSCPTVLHEFDNWSYHRIWADEYEMVIPLDASSAIQLGMDSWRKKKVDASNLSSLSMYFTDLNQGITTILSLVVRLSVLYPISVFFLGVELRFLLWLQQLSRLPYWASVLFALPLFLVLECVLSWRYQFFWNLENLVSLACGSKNILVVPPSLNPFSAKRLDGQGVVVASDGPFKATTTWSASSSLYCGEAPFDPYASPAEMWWAITLRPLWGIYYLAQRFSGACFYGRATRNDDDAPYRPKSTSLSGMFVSETNGFTEQGCIVRDQSAFDDFKEKMAHLDKHHGPGTINALTRKMSYVEPKI